MSHHDSEEELVAEANRVLGTSDVEAAGLFGLADLSAAMVAGTAVGSSAGKTAGAAVGSGALGSALGAGAGGYVATRAYADAKGVDLLMILAVTAKDIYVLNRESGDQPPGVVARFDRQRCEVRVSKLGLSRTIELHDPDSGAALSLHGTVSPFMGRSKPDKLVMGLLANA